MPSTARRVLVLVTEEPGIHKSEIVRRLGLAWGTVGYHLNRLVRDGKIVQETTRREVRLYRSYLDADERRRMHALRHPERRALLEVLRAGPSRLHRIAATTGLSRKVIRRHLTVLDEAGVVRSDGEPRPRYVIDEGAHGHDPD